MDFLWTTINVSSMDRSLDFYTKVLDLPLQRRFNPVPHMEVAFLGTGETKVELISDSRKKPEHSKDVALGFRTSSLDKKMEEISSSGIEIYEGPLQPAPHIRFFYILDPDGVKIQFVEEKQEMS